MRLDVFLASALLVASTCVSVPSWACDPVTYVTVSVGTSTGPDCLTVRETSDPVGYQAEVLIENTCSGVALTACSGGCDCDSLNLAPDDLVQLTLNGGGGEDCIVDVDAPEGAGQVQLQFNYESPAGACGGPFGCSATAGQNMPTATWPVFLSLLGLAVFRRR